MIFYPFRTQLQLVSGISLFHLLQHWLTHKQKSTRGIFIRRRHFIDDISHVRVLVFNYEYYFSVTKILNEIIILQWLSAVRIDVPVLSTIEHQD